MLAAATVAAAASVYVGVVIWRDASKGTHNSYNASRARSGGYLVAAGVAVGLTFVAVLAWRFIFGSV